MNKNIDNYKKAIDQIHTDVNLKEKTKEKILEKEKKSKRKINYFFRYAVSIAAVSIVAVVRSKNIK